MGFFEEQGIKVALLEPNDPSGTSPPLPFLSIFSREVNMADHKSFQM